MDYVDLNRRFVEFSGTEDAEAAAALSLDLGAFYGTSGWPELLQQKCAVVLGEAGTGKTKEFEEQARRLSAERRFGCFIPLEDLADRQISPEIENALERWRSESEEGFFFLDSVDEARLGHRQAFRRALEDFVRRLESAAGRARVFVSCRVSDWQRDTDPNTILRVLRPVMAPNQTTASVTEAEPADATPSPSESAVASVAPAGDSSSRLPIYRLVPLDDDRIAHLARAIGVTNLDQFMASLRGGDLQEFAGRPRDLEWLVSYWRIHRGFGSLTDMLEENVRHKLEEHNPVYTRSRASLSPERRREGVELLAAACILCSRPLILLPEPELSAETPKHAFQPAETLLSWSEAEIRELLTCGIFDPATFGRVRFHDPRVKDYLAACWMANRRTAGQRVSRLRRLVIGEAFDRPRPVPSKKMVLGWLAGKSAEIRDAAIESAPDVVLYCGDASRIPVQDRAQALRNLALLLNRIGRSDWIVYDNDVRRIVHPDLEPTVQELLVDHLDDYELARLLLRMVRLGDMGSCADIALRAARNSDLDDGVRKEAAHALCQVGSADQRSALAECARRAPDMSNNLLGALCSALFPGTVTVGVCLAIARRAKPEKPGLGRGIGHHFSDEITDDCPPPLLAELLQGLIGLAWLPPMITSPQGDLISKRFAWTLDPIVALFRRILREFEPAEFPTESMAQAYLLIDRCRDNLTDWHIDTDDLGKDLARSSSMHRSIFWSVVRDRLSRGSPVPQTAWQIGDELLALDKADLDWLFEDIRQCTEKSEVEAACETALWICISNGRSEQRSQDLAAAVSRAVAADSQLKEHVSGVLFPPPRPESQWEREHRDKMRAREAEKQAALQRLRAHLAERMEALRSATDFASLWKCHEHMRRSKGSSSFSWAQTNIAAIANDFGDEVATAARDGFKMYWRSVVPSLPCEREDAQGTEYAVLVGLTGLALEAMEPGGLTRLTTLEAEIATLYAVRELNGFPTWLEDLAETHPIVVREVLVRQVDAEYAMAIDPDYRPEVLSIIRYGDGVIRELCADSLLDRLGREEPKNLRVLETALETIFSLRPERWACLAPVAAKGAAAAVATGDDLRLLAWLEAWLRADGVNAAMFLEKLVSQRGESPSPLVFRLAAALGHESWGGRDAGLQAHLAPGALERLIPLFYTHVRIEDDVRHEGMHEIGPRDDAQRFRGSLPSWLASQPGPQAQRILKRLAGTLGDDDLKQWMERLAEQQAALSVEYRHWSPQDVAVFGRGLEVDPKTGAELFEIACERISDIKEDIEGGDFSDRDLFQPEMPEKQIQKWLAGRLRREGRDRYAVTREDEVDRSDEIDIRLHHSVAGCVTIEIKPVESGTSRYSFNDLVAALKDQLVGQYMRDARSLHGILVVAMLGERRWRAPENRQWIEFGDVIDRLNAIAEEVEKSDRNVERLSVIGIDFT